MARIFHRPARFGARSLALIAALALASTGVAAQGAQGAAAVMDAASSAHTLSVSDRAPVRAGNSVDTAFTRADADGDNRLSRDEAQRLPAVNERFDEIDSNHDRFLSREEFRRGVAN